MTDPLQAYVDAHAAQNTASSEMARAFAAYVRERDDRVNAELAALRKDMNSVLQALQNVGGQLDQLNKR